MCVASYSFAVLTYIIMSAPFEPADLCGKDYLKVENSELKKCEKGASQTTLMKVKQRKCEFPQVIYEPAVVSCAAFESYSIVFNELFEETDNSKRCEK